MNSHFFVLYLFNIFINSFLAFFTVALFVYLYIFIFRIKNLRTKMLLLSLPVIKLLVDPFLYHFSNWALWQNMHPLSQETGTRMLSLKLGFPSPIATLPNKFALLFSLKSGQTFTIADLLSEKMGAQLMSFLIGGVLLISLVLILRFFLCLCRSYKTLQQIKSEATIYTSTVSHPSIRGFLEKNKAQVFLSDHVSSPCTLGVFSPVICFPTNLISQLTNQEIQAVIAHEIGHIYWKDACTNLLFAFLKALFWWIPIKWLIKHIQLHQEMSCDRQALAYGLAPLDILSALAKTGNSTPSLDHPMVCRSFFSKSSFSKRLKVLAKKRFKKESLLAKMLYPVLLLIAYSLLLGRFWIF